MRCAVIRAVIEIYAVSRIGPSFDRSEVHAATQLKYTLRLHGFHWQRQPRVGG
jgi:hypothetical protein